MVTKKSQRELSPPLLLSATKVVKISGNSNIMCSATRPGRTASPII